MGGVGSLGNAHLPMADYGDNNERHNYIQDNHHDYALDDDNERNSDRNYIHNNHYDYHTDNQRHLAASRRRAPRGDCLGNGRSYAACMSSPWIVTWSLLFPTLDLLVIMALAPCVL